MAVSSTLRALVVLLTPVKLAGVAHAFFQTEKLSCVISLATRLTVFFAYAYIARPLLHLVLFSFQGLYTLIFHVASSWCTMYFFCSNSNKNNNNTPSAEKTTIMVMMRSDTKKTKAFRIKEINILWKRKYHEMHMILALTTYHSWIRITKFFY